MTMTAAEVTEARKVLGMRRADFARALHVTPRTVRSWEAGEYSIPLVTATLIRLAVKFPQVKRELVREAAERKAAEKSQPAAA